MPILERGKLRLRELCGLLKVSLLVNDQVSTNSIDRRLSWNVGIKRDKGMFSFCGYIIQTGDFSVYFRSYVNRKFLRPEEKVY